MFESRPFQILMNIGLLGYASLLGLDVLSVRLMSRAWRVRSYRDPIAAAAVTLFLRLLADSAHPYLVAPAHGWPVFLLIGVCVPALCSQEPTDEGA